MGTVIPFPGRWKGTAQTKASPQSVARTVTAIEAPTLAQMPPPPMNSSLNYPAGAIIGPSLCPTCNETDACECEKCWACEGSGDAVASRPDKGVCSDCGGSGTVRDASDVTRTQPTTADE